MLVILFSNLLLLLVAFAQQQQKLQSGSSDDGTSGGNDAQVPIPPSADYYLSASMGFYKVDQCMLSVQPQVCDPDGILSSADAAKINAQLVQLERNSRTGGQSSLRTFRGECPPSGLTLQILLFKNLADPQNTDQKIMDLHVRWSLAHPCHRSAVIMLSPGPDYRSQYPDWNREDYYVRRYPAGVWSKFYAISSINAEISPSELVQFYRDSIDPIRSGEIGQALMNIIEKVRNRLQT